MRRANKNIKLLQIFIVFFSLLINEKIYAQKNDKEKIDSLLALLPRLNEDTNKVNTYVHLFYAYNSFNCEEALKYVEPALQLAEKLKWPEGIAKVKNNIGRVYWRLGKFEPALKYHNEALKIYEEANNRLLIAVTLMFIAQDYADGGNYAEAKKFLFQALKIFQGLGDKKRMSNTYNLLAWVYGNEGNNVEATKFNFACLKIDEELGDINGVAIEMSNIAEYYITIGNYKEALRYCLSAVNKLEQCNDIINLINTYTDIGKIYILTGNYTEALKNYRFSLHLASEINNKFQMALAYCGIGELYIAQGLYSAALANLLSSAELYKAVYNKQELSNVYSKISICYTKLNNFKEAKKYIDDNESLVKELSSKVTFASYFAAAELLDSSTRDWKDAYLNFKNHIVYRDSISGQENTQKMVQAQMQYDSDKKDALEKAEQEKKDIRQRTIRNSITAGLAASLIFLTVVYRQRNKIAKARKRSDELLLNILPEEVAEELKEKGSADAKHFTEVTVMFTDFKGFTQISEKLTPAELVAEIDTCFKAFDNIITKYNIEKIKTIGDSYMCAGGLPVENTTHATDVVKAALEIQQFMQQHLQQRKNENKELFEIRIGIHTGPVVAGIVGVKKFAYDIWGDTVNIASRMESSGEAGKVNISGSTYELVKDKFKCEHRGKIQAKNKGEIDMFFVNRS